MNCSRVRHSISFFWKKLNHSFLNYDQIVTASYLNFFGGILYGEPQNPHIVIDRNEQATLHIKDVGRDDEGTYKILESLL